MERRQGCARTEHQDFRGHESIHFWSGCGRKGVAVSKAPICPSQLRSGIADGPASMHGRLLHM